MAGNKKKSPVLLATPFFFIYGAVLAGIVLFSCALFFQRNDGLDDVLTLKGVCAAARSMPEHPAMANTNLVRPDYKAHYRLFMTDGYAERMRSFVGMGRPARITKEIFKEVLTETIALLLKDEFEKNFLYKCEARAGDQFIVWGDIQGAYHSVVRGLTNLYKTGLIDDQMRLTGPRTKIVFMGDAISRSAYGMEVLTLILLLMKQNPGRVIYLRGNHEDKKYWHAFGLRDQIEVLFGKEQARSLIKQVDALFAQLPLALYLALPGTENEFVRLSHLGWQRSRVLQEEFYSDFLLAAQKNDLDGHMIKKNKNASGGVQVRAILRSEKKRHSFQAMDGIRLLASERGATSWTLLSSPTTVSQKGLKYHHDAYALITAGATDTQWRLDLFNRDAQKDEDFASRSYDFLSGESVSS